ncbi:MAG: TonB-dependent receptor, partial [Opitutus sp.]|nr:TonB-dependent receptor [Opitutus sp.]
MNAKSSAFLLPALLVLSAMLASIGVASAAEGRAGGELTGHVSNAATRASLEGASVRLNGTTWRTLTDPTGQFSFDQLPAGNYSMTVEYTGLEAQTREVVVRAADKSRIDVALTSDIYRMEAFTVASEREGNALSITRQRNADNVVNVVSMDTFGNVADGNIGNFMQRLPGVGVVIEMGDIVGFGVRGTPSEFNAVNIDGVRSSNAYGGANPQGDRAVVVDSIPSDFIKEIELVKALTPDLAADSIGGAANLVTKSALDFKNSVLTYRAGLNQNTFRKDDRRWAPTGALGYMTRLGGAQNVGLAFSSSYAESTNSRDRVQMTRTQTDGRNTQARTLDDVATRTRGGLSLKVDYRPVAGFELHASVQYTYFSFQLVRTDWNIAASNVNV